MVELAKQVSKANFPFLNCNYNLTETPLQNFHKPYKIVKKGNAKIGITGIGINLDGLADPSNIKNLQYNNPFSNVERVADHLKNNENCDLVICLSHLGYRYKFDKISDTYIANNTKNIDIIIGGHTHTFMDKPDYITNQHNKNVTVHQAGWGGLRLGVLDVKIPIKS
jgi:5'-nucleotidase